MVVVPGGAFLMGSPPGEGYPDEQPRRRVDVAPFRLGTYPVTQAEWVAVMGDNRSRFRGDRWPAENVSHARALEYCRRLSDLAFGVVRGGSWHDPPDLCRSAARLRQRRSEGDDWIGLRVAL